MRVLSMKVRGIIFTLTICTIAAFNFGSQNVIRIRSESASLNAGKFAPINENSVVSTPIWTHLKRALALLLVPALFIGPIAKADDELANFASQGNKVGVDGLCFFRKCALETTKCGNDPNCLKGLACLSRCKGASLCSTGCFAKYGSERLDNLLYCSVEKNDCVHVPRADNAGWVKDKVADLPTAPLASFRPASLRGTWYKIMGLDSRYDCFDCQKNSFTMEDKKTLEMKALFRIPRPNFPGYLQSSISEELRAPDVTADSISHLQSQGKMFGLTFWENWYILGEHNVNTVSRERTRNAHHDDNGGGGGGTLLPRAYAASASSTAFEMDDALSSPPAVPASDDKSALTSFITTIESEPDLKLVYYTGHTLQGNYKGAFLYSRSADVSPRVMAAANDLISRSGLQPRDFCLIRNQCFKSDSPEPSEESSLAAVGNLKPKDTPFWYIGQKFFQGTEQVANELADWFQDPVMISDWLVNQQQRMILRQPLAVSPFASLPEDFSSDTLYADDDE
eukprot:gene11127-23260_t